MKPERTNFGRHRPVFEPDDLLAVQKRSFEAFLQPDTPPDRRSWTQGPCASLEGLFRGKFPIESYDGHYVLEFVKYELSKSDPAKPQPNDDPLAALREGVTYSASLNVTFRLKNGESCTEETVYMGEFPLMTESGSFVINGAERVIVSQLHRSPGICTERHIHANGTPLHSVSIIPDRGCWLEFQFDTNKQIWGFLDRRRKRRKFLASTFLRCLGYSSDRDILSNFYEYRQISTKEKRAEKLATLVFPEDVRDAKTGALLAHRYDFATPEALRLLELAGIPEIELIDVTWDDGRFLHTLRADTTTNEEEALKDFYHKLRPGDPCTVSNASEFMRRFFFDPRHYNLGNAGRFILDKRLKPFRNPDLGELYQDPKKKRLLSKSDIIAAIRMLVALSAEGPAAKLDPKPQWKFATRIPVDDIYHLGSRRIRTVGELLKNCCSIGLSRTERVIHERMSLASSQNQEGETEQLRPTRLVNSKTFGAVVADFFARNELSQFMDETNPLSALAHKRRLSALGPGGLSRDRAGFEVRDVHPSHYGRLCPIETPEGPNIGLISSLGIYAHLNEYGFVETPYRCVKLDKKGEPFVTDEVVYMSADEEEQYVIAQANARLDRTNHFIDPNIRVRHKAEFQEMPRAKVQFMDVSPMQVISIAAGLIPFLEHDDANRALMGANMMRQAVPLLRTERPYVATGLEGRVAHDSKVVVVVEEDGVVTEVDARHIVVTPNARNSDEDAPDAKPAPRRYDLQKFRRTNAGTCFNQWPIVAEGDKVKKGDVLADGPATDQGELSLGKNLLVAYMPWCGYNFEDAILVSQRIVRDDVFTSVHILEFECTARATKLGDEEITRDIPNVGEDALRNLDERGVIRVGAEVKPGDILVGKVTPKSETELMSEERLLRAIFGEKAAEVRDTSLRVQPGTFGIVLDVLVKTAVRESEDLGSQEPTDSGAGILGFRRPRLMISDWMSMEEFDLQQAARNDTVHAVKIFLAEKKPIRVGDKFSGRHGNKGVLCRVVPDEDMPFLPNGRPVDVVLNPLGVPSRMNLGQLFEAKLGLAACALETPVASPVFDGATENEIEAWLEKASRVPGWEWIRPDGKTVLYDGRTGERFDQRVMVGVTYMLKLHHLVTDKIHARAVGPYSLVTQQPLGGKAQAGGQRMGEMEVWALEAYGVAYALQEMLTVKSDDVAGRTRIYESIVKGQNALNAGMPETFKVLISELKGLCLDMRLEKAGESGLGGVF